MGGHACSCPQCGHEGRHFNSCRDRHCPQCQSLDQVRWFEERQDVLLPVGHHHVVLTLPSQLRALTQQQPEVMLGILCEAAQRSLIAITREHLGGTVGVTAVLHTWTRDLLYHPHLHCVVTAGAWTGTRWVHRKKWLVPGRQLAAAFRGRFLALLEKRREQVGLDEEAYRILVRTLPPKREWVVFCQPPMSDLPGLVRYLANYTHRVAISDHRLLAFDGRYVTFRGTQGKRCRLPAAEFARRFLMHVLPPGFRKIRHWGLYAPGRAKEQREASRAALLAEPAIATREQRRHRREREDESWQALLRDVAGADPSCCPNCGGPLIFTRIFPARGPP